MDGTRYYTNFFYKIKESTTALLPVTDNTSSWLESGTKFQKTTGKEIKINRKVRVVVLINLYPDCVSPVRGTLKTEVNFCN